MSHKYGIPHVDQPQKSAAKRIGKSVKFKAKSIDQLAPQKPFVKEKKGEK